MAMPNKMTRYSLTTLAKSITCRSLPDIDEVNLPLDRDETKSCDYMQLGKAKATMQYFLLI